MIVASPVAGVPATNETRPKPCAVRTTYFLLPTWRTISPFTADVPFPEILPAAPVAGTQAVIEIAFSWFVAEPTLPVSTVNAPVKVSVPCVPVAAVIVGIAV